MKWYQEWSRETNPGRLELGDRLVVPLSSLLVGNGMMTGWHYHTAAASARMQGLLQQMPRAWDLGFMWPVRQW